MKNLKSVLFLFVLIPAFLTAGCSFPESPTGGPDKLTYKVESSESSLSADIVYCDGENEIVSLTDQSLPWIRSIELTSTFTGEAYLKADVEQAEVFVPFLTGTAGSPSTHKLVDSDADFITDGVVAGDKIYIDPGALEYADVVSVDNSNTLSLNANLFVSGGEPYNIYHLKTLRTAILFNEAIVIENTSESEKLLNGKVLTMVYK